MVMVAQCSRYGGVGFAVHETAFSENKTFFPCRACASGSIMVNTISCRFRFSEEQHNRADDVTFITHHNSLVWVGKYSWNINEQRNILFFKKGFQGSPEMTSWWWATSTPISLKWCETNTRSSQERLFHNTTADVLCGGIAARRLVSFDPNNQVLNLTILQLGLAVWIFKAVSMWNRFSYH